MTNKFKHTTRWERPRSEPSEINQLLQIVSVREAQTQRMRIPSYGMPAWTWDQLHQRIVGSGESDGSRI